MPADFRGEDAALRSEARGGLAEMLLGRNPVIDGAMTIGYASGMLPTMAVDPAESATARRFVWTWLGLVVGIIVILFPAITFALLNWFDHPSLRWIEEIRARKFHIAKKLATQGRIIVAGGSSAFFSIDAELLEAKLGIPTVNVASHAGLGLRFLLRDARKAAREGDTVLLHIEYELYRDRDAGREMREKIERKYLWTYDRGYLFALPPVEALRQLYGNSTSDYRESWKRWNERLRGTTTLANPDSWTWYPFILLGPRGDFRAGLGTAEKFKAPQLSDITAVRGVAADELRRFFRWCRVRNIRVATILPGVLRAAADGPSEETFLAMRAVQDFHRQEGVPALGDPATLQFPREFFYDTHYHANAGGRRLRTEALVGDLKSLLGIPAHHGEPTTFLLHDSETAFHRALSFADNDAVDYRFIATSGLNHPWTITPAEVGVLCRQNRQVLFAEPEIATLLKGIQLESAVVHREAAALPDWFRTYPEHVFVLATIGTPPRLSTGKDAPEGLQEFAAHRASCRAAILGTGTFANVRVIAGGDDKARVRQTADRRWQAELPFPMEIRASASKTWPVSKEISPIVIARQSIIAPTQEGVAVAVVDPRLGIVVQRGIFANGECVAFELRRAEATRD